MALRFNLEDGFAAFRWADMQQQGLRGRANPEVDNIIAMCDASHRGDRLINNRSQTGVIICLNGVPVITLVFRCEKSEF